MNKKIAFLGAGNMAEAIMAGLVKSGLVRPGGISAFDVKSERLRYLKRKFGVNPAQNNSSALKGAAVVLLCVKPQMMEELLCEIGLHIRPGQLVISIAAGITTKYIERFLIKGVPVVRVMPNTALLAGAGATAVSAGKYAKERHVSQAVKLFSVSGITERVPEKKINAVTALSGSGPAYIFYMAEMLKDAGVKMGLPADVSEALSRQTVYGAGKMLKETGFPASQLRKNVTSPGGTTEAAIKFLDKKGFAGIFKAAVKRAKERAGELSR